MTPQDINANYIADLYGETYLAEVDPAPRKRLAVSALFSGFIVVAIASAAATWFSEHYGMPVILAGLLLGLALNFVSAEQKVHPGLDFCGTSCLRWGIVLLGTQVTAMQIGSLGALAFLGLIAIMAVVIGAGLLGARLGGQSNYAGWLAGGATAICGASAALAIYAVIGRERLNQSQFTLTLVGVALASAIAMSFYPLIAAYLQFTDKQAGFLMGAAVHDVAQALGGGYSFSESAGETATIVKLSRVALLAPAVALIGLAIGSSGSRPKSLLAKLKLPWFILAFFAAVAINSLIEMPVWVAKYGLIASKAMLLFAVTATAMRSRLDLLLGQGWKALLPVILATITAFAGGSVVRLGRIVSDAVYDLAVIGGGINGAGIARDAAGRGAKVILLERGDLARGTSSASTKLIHGGLRYLEHYEFKLVRESLVERERLWAIAPHIIWPLRFVLPYQKSIRPAWLVRLGLFLYDHIGGRKRLPPTRSLNLKTDPAGRPLKPGFEKAFEYSDCWVDDARMVVLNAMDAAENGAAICTQSEVTHLERRDGHWHIEVAEQAPVRAKAVVNAAGPAVLDLLSRTAGHQRDDGEKIRLVRGSHIIVRQLFETAQAYFCQNPDGRIFFAIPYEDDFTLIGTTDADHHGGLDNIEATENEIAYICGSANSYFKQQITPADVIYSYAGVRPLVDDGSGKPETASRGYHFDLDTGADGNAPILSVFGGKITTYRHLAESAVERLSSYLSELVGPGWTRDKALPGGDFPMDGAAALAASLSAAYPFLPEEVIRRLVRSYGTRARTWLGNATSVADLGEYFGHGLYMREVDYLITKEWAGSADDILWRRTKLGLRFAPDEIAALERYVSATTKNESV